MEMRWTLGRWLGFGILVLGLNLIGVGTLPLVDRDEPRFAEATREMRASGDWIIPMFNGAPRYDKPPMLYWLQALSTFVFGESEWSLRLPSAMAGAGVACLLVLWGRRAAGDPAGWMAGSLFATSLQVAVHSRLAVADMLLTFWVAVAAWAAWEVGQAEEGSLTWGLAFWSALGFGFLTKGPVAWIPAAVVLVADRVPQSSHRKRIRSWHLGLGLSVLLVILGGWGIPALIQSRGDFLSLGLGRHVIQRFVGSLDGHGSGSIADYLLKLPYFGLTVWPSFFPGSIWIPWFLRAVWRQRNFDPLLRHCFWGLGLTFGVFTLCNTKLPHYLLPAFPWMAVALAVVWARSGRPAGPWLRWCGLAGASTAILAMVSAEMGRQTLPARVLFEDVRYWPVGTSVATTEFREPSVVWYARAAEGPNVEFLEFGDAVEFLKRPGPRACLFQEAEFESWRRDADLSLRPSPIFCRFSGWNPVHGRRVNLVLVRFIE